MKKYVYKEICYLYAKDLKKRVNLFVNVFTTVLSLYNYFITFIKIISQSQRRVYVIYIMNIKPACYP